MLVEASNFTMMPLMRPHNFFVEFLWKNPSTWQYMKYDAIHFLLAITYAILLITALVMLSKFHYNSKAFVATFVAGTTLRMVFFATQPFIREGIFRLPNAINFMLGTLPSFFFFSTYMMMLFFWGEIFRTNESFRRRGLGRRVWMTFGALNSTMYSIVVLLFVVDLVQSSKTGQAWSPVSTPLSIYEQGVQVLAAAMYLAVSVGFFIYAYSTFRIAHQRNDSSLLVHSQERRKLLRRVGTITLFCMSAFLARAAMTLWTVFDTHMDWWWWLDGAYYSLLEVVPAISMLFVYVEPRQNRIDGDPLLGSSSLLV